MGTVRIAISFLLLRSVHVVGACCRLPSRDVLLWEEDNDRELERSPRLHWMGLVHDLSGENQELWTVRMTPGTTMLEEFGVE